MRWIQPRLTAWERAMVVAMVLMALGQGLLCVVAPNQFVRTFSLVACCGAILYAACLFLSAGRRWLHRPPTDLVEAAVSWSLPAVPTAQRELEGRLVRLATQH